MVFMGDSSFTMKTIFLFDKPINIKIYATQKRYENDRTPNVF